MHEFSAISVEIRLSSNRQTDNTLTIMVDDKVSTYLSVSGGVCSGMPALSENRHFSSVIAC